MYKYLYPYIDSGDRARYQAHVLGRSDTPRGLVVMRVGARPNDFMGCPRATALDTMAESHLAYMTSASAMDVTSMRVKPASYQLIWDWIEDLATAYQHGLAVSYDLKDGELSLIHESPVKLNNTIITYSKNLVSRDWPGLICQSTGLISAFMGH